MAFLRWLFRVGAAVAVCLPGAAMAALGAGGSHFFSLSNRSWLAFVGFQILRCVHDGDVGLRW